MLSQEIPCFHYTRGVSTARQSSLDFRISSTCFRKRYRVFITLVVSAWQDNQALTFVYLAHAFARDIVFSLHSWCQHGMINDHVFRTWCQHGMINDHVFRISNTCFRKSYRVLFHARCGGTTVYCWLNPIERIIHRFF